MSVVSKVRVKLQKSMYTFLSLFIVMTSTLMALPTSQYAQATSNNTPVSTLNSTSFTTNPITVSGNVYNTTQQPLQDIWVMALETTTYQMIAGSQTSNSGEYSLTLPNNDYYLYIVDRTGNHPSGFYGGNNPIIISVENTSNIEQDIVLQSTKGTLQGYIHDSQHTPIAGAWAMILSANTSNTGEPVAVVTADSNGYYQTPALPPGQYFVGWLDPQGNHAPAFYPQSTTVPDSTPVTITANTTTQVNGQLLTKPQVAGQGQLSGQITNESNQSLEGIRVVALKEHDYSFAQATITDNEGYYSLSLPTDQQYKLAFIDQSGHYLPEWSGNVAMQDLGSAVSVAAPSHAINVLSAKFGSVAGTIRDHYSQIPLNGIWVVAMGANGPVGGTITNNQGEYNIDHLPSGTYQITVVDPNRYRVLSNAQNNAGNVIITNNNTTHLDASLLLATTTQENRDGQPLEEFPFPIMVYPPHRPHSPVTDFASVTKGEDGSYVFNLPTQTSDDGLYGRFWLSPKPPTPGALLTGVRIKQASWSGQSANSIVVFSLLDRATENNAIGTVTGITQGLPNEIVGVLFDQYSETIELKLTTPTSYTHNRFVFAIDTENLPMGQDQTIFPDSIRVGQIEWLWQAPNN